MEIKITNIKSAYTKVTFSKSTDEIRLKWGVVDLNEEIKNKILSLIKEIKNFYIKENIDFTLRGHFGISDNNIRICLRDNNRHKKHSIISAALVDGNNYVNFSEPYKAYLEINK